MPAVACPGGAYRVGLVFADHIRTGSSVLDLWTIDGAAASSREGLFSSLAAALSFPDYFGHNWDATYDCLTDLAGSDGRPGVLVITQGDLLLAGMGPEWATAQRVFADTAEFWQGRERPFLVLLVSDAALENVPALPPTCQEQLLALVEADRAVIQADEQIRTLNRAGNFAEALETAQELVTQFPENPRAHFVLGGTFDFQDREAEAVLPYQRAWALGLAGEDVPRFYVQFGSTLRNVGQFDESVRVLREGRERFPEDAAIQAFLALALFSSGRAADALATALSIIVESSGRVDLSGYERALREYIVELHAPHEAL